MYKYIDIHNVRYSSFLKLKRQSSSFINTFLILYFSFIFLLYLSVDIKFIYGQTMIDSFLAQGIIGSRISYDNQSENDTSQPPLEPNDDQDKSTIGTILENDFFKKDNENNNNNTSSDNKVTKIATLQGNWNLQVLNGDVTGFFAIFSLAPLENKIVNAFAINNFTNINYIQINEKGTEIINGKGDLASLGLINSTRDNIDITIILSGFKMKIILDNINAYKFFNDNSIQGITTTLVDGNGRYLIGSPAKVNTAPDGNVPIPRSQQNIQIPPQNTPMPQPRENIPIPLPPTNTPMPPTHQQNVPSPQTQ